MGWGASILSECYQEEYVFMNEEADRINLSKYRLESAESTYRTS